MNPSRPLLHAAGSIAFLCGLCVAADAGATPQFELELEGGAVWQTRNDVRIPNDATGTRFSLSDLAGQGPYPSGRGFLTWNLDERHSLRALAAPLRIRETGTPAESIGFGGELFAADTATRATYRFDSWRLTYRYRFTDGGRIHGWVGFTAKVRDAEIELAQGDRVATDTNVGFVPLLHLAADVELADGWHLLADVDALAGGPGRAIDGALKIGVDVTDAFRLTAGYRSLEGGADVDDVYTFAWLHYAVVSSVWRFGG